MKPIMTERKPIMTKGTKAFRIIISILLALTLLWSAFWGMAVISCLQNPRLKPSAENSTRRIHNDILKGHDRHDQGKQDF